MDDDLRLLGIEVIVEDLDRALELFADVLGCAVISRAPSQLVAGETAVVDLGSLVLTLLAPAATGEGSVLAERAPRLSQFVFSSDAGTGPFVDRAMESGLATVQLSQEQAYVTPEAVEGALGQPVAVVVVGAPER
jgi:catechol 2,3-dioxygenase-like lactoylglutathione lyase family enzyme